MSDETQKDDKTSEDLKKELEELKSGNSELEEKITELENSNSNTVEELKELRKKKQELEQQLKDKEEPDEPGDEDVKSQVKKVLTEEKKGEAEKNRKEAFDNFISKHKEFHPDSDESGLKRKALEEELENLKTDQAQSIRDFEKLFEKAMKLVSKEDKPGQKSVSPDANTPPSSGTPSQVKTSSLTDKEKRLLEQSDFSEEKYLDLKKKNPAYIDSLLKTIE